MKRFAIPVLLSLGLFACNSSGNQHPSAQYEEKKTSLEEMERDSPPKFLKITGSLRSNLLNQTIVEGEITNRATLVTYKDMQVQISFIDKEGSVIEKQKHVIETEIKPGGSEDFKIKVSHVKGANSISLVITDAVADK